MRPLPSGRSGRVHGVHALGLRMLPHPATIGRFHVRSCLGQGGMGVVYFALDPDIDRLVALKLLRVDSEEMRDRFLREARSAGRLQHPNIVTVYDVGRHGESPFIAMEYVAGQTFAELIQHRAPLSLSRKLALAAQLCGGLAYTHQGRSHSSRHQTGQPDAQR